MPASTHPRHAAQRLLLAAFVVLVAVVVAAPPVTAHAELEQASPGPGAVVAAVPPRLTLRFTEPLIAVERLTVRHADHLLDDGRPIVDASGAIVTIALDTSAGVHGPVRVDYRAASSDGHVIEGGYDFTVEPSSGVQGGEPTAAELDTGSEAPHEAVPEQPATERAAVVSATSPATDLALPLGAGALAATGVACIAMLANRRTNRSEP